MPALDFAPEFAEKVRTWHKRQTIRRVRKVGPIKVGDRLIFYTRQRHTDCQKLGEAICTEVIPVRLWLTKKGLGQVEINGVQATPEQRVALAESDGFAGTRDMIKWFKNRYQAMTARKPWEGVIIKW